MGTRRGGGASVGHRPLPWKKRFEKNVEKVLKKILTCKRPPSPMLSVKFVPKKVPMLCVNFSPKKPPPPHVKR